MAHSQEVDSINDYMGGTAAPWYRGWDITEEKRSFFRKTAQESREAKLRALNGEGVESQHAINVPLLDPAELMPRVRRHQLAALSLFSGGGGIDLGFDRAGYVHVA